MKCQARNPDGETCGRVAYKQIFLPQISNFQPTTLCENHYTNTKLCLDSLNIHVNSYKAETENGQFDMFSFAKEQKL